MDPNMELPARRSGPPRAVVYLRCSPHWVPTFRAQSANSERLAIAGGGSLASPRSWPGLPRHAALGLYTIHSPRALAGHVIGRVRALVMILLRGEADPLRHLATHLPEDCPVSRTSARQRLPAIALVMTSVLIAGCIGSTPSDSGGKNPPFRAPVTAPSPATPGGAASRVGFLRVGRPVPGRYIVVLRDNEGGAVPRVDGVVRMDAATRLEAIGRKYRAEPVQIFRHVFSGFAARMSEADALAASQDPDVAFVEEDGEIWHRRRNSQRVGVSIASTSATCLSTVSSRTTRQVAVFTPT